MHCLLDDPSDPICSRPVPRRRLTLLGAALAVALLTAGATAQDVVHGFDEVSAPGPFAFIVPGFANGPHLEYQHVTLDGGVILLDVLFGNSATSGPNILATCDTCLLGDGPPATGLPGLITGAFPHAVDRIDLDVINGSTASGGTFTLTARDAGGGVLATDSVFASTMGSGGFVQHLSVAVDGIRSFTVTTGLSGGYSFAIDTLSFHRADGTWTDLGQGLAGTHGVPTLSGLGSLKAGATTRLTLAGALENATTTLVIGFDAIDLPFKGGVMVPRPDVLIPALSVSPAGGLLLVAPWPPGLPPGFEITFQHWIADVAGPAGFAASNGLSATTP
ncbi:MAG: hypothetical protein ACYTG2_00790 [Planctomycetota bacterium]|jgi:hypothetical protein